MYSNKFNPSSNTSKVALAVIAVVALHYVGFEALKASDDRASSTPTSDSVQSQPAAPVAIDAPVTVANTAASTVDTIIVTGKRL
jgi:NO-binding membrane sensor protein with MHYT domain